MDRKIHFEDDIFYIVSFLKNLKDNLKLNIDKNFFLDKVVEDIFFVDSTIKKIYTILNQNKQMIHRFEHLHSLLRAKKQFIRLLDNILDEELVFAVHMSEFFQQFKNSKDELQNSVDEILKLLKTERDDSENENTISKEELHYLFMPDEDEEAG